MSLPPGVLAQRLVRVFPQFLLCDATLSTALGSYLSPVSNPAMSDLVQWLQNNPGSAASAGNTLNPPAAPQTSAAPLEAALVAALLSPLTSTSSWVITQSAFQDVAWTVRQGITPGPETPQPATGAWRLTTQTPLGGVVFSEIAYAIPTSGSFTLSLVNDQPRHLGVYARFSKDGTTVVPAGWRSQLPTGVSTSFETDTVKYLGVLIPNAAVAGIAVSSARQTITVTLPANADAVQLLFGGLGGTDFAAVPDAAGLLLTFVLDVFVPWVVVSSGQGGSDVAQWYNGLLSDPSLVANVLSSGAFLTQVADPAAMFAALSANLTGVMLGKPLRKLRDSTAEQLGSPPEKDYSWVDQFAPAAGWAAQLVQSFLTGGLHAQYWAAGTPATLSLDLSPATTLTLYVTLTPDPSNGIWPWTAMSSTLVISYARGFSQILKGQIPSAPNAAPLTVGFGSVRNAGPIDLIAQLQDASGTIVAQASTRIVPPADTATRTVPVQLAVTDMPSSVGATTQYKRVARLTYTAGTYVWDANAGQSTKVGLSPVGGAIPALTSLNGLTLQGTQFCLGYAWGASNQTAIQCGGNTPLPNAYFIQDIGTALPMSQLKTIDCGLVVAPQLTYTAFGQVHANPGSGYYVDTQGPGFFLRPVTFVPGTFNLQASTSVAQFPAQAGSVCTCLHPAGYAAVVSGDQDLLQIVALAPGAVADAQAPMAVAFAGTGSRIGLLSGPVGIAVTPDGFFLVLEQGNLRVQAFDVGGNPVPLFGGQPIFALRSVPGPVLCDIAVSDQGFIYVLGGQNGRKVAADCFLDIYDPDGTLLCTSASVNAAKLVVDASQTVYTLDYDALTGQGGRTEPTLSAWRPGSGS
jgi:hypothetical protein